MDDLKLEHKDFVYLGTTTLTVPLLEVKFEQMRQEFFDQDLVALPVVSESKRVLRPDSLSAQESDYLDNAPYDFDDPVHETRFNNEFDFHSAFLRAVQQSTDRVFRLRRRVTQEYYSIHAQYTSLYSSELAKYGAKAMGSNNTERDAWFHNHYPALYEIDALYENFINEISIEIDRLQQLGSTASRSLAATENSYRARGLLNDRKVMSY